MIIIRLWQSSFKVLLSVLTLIANVNNSNTLGGDINDYKNNNGYSITVCSLFICLTITCSVGLNKPFTLCQNLSKVNKLSPLLPISLLLIWAL